NATLSYAVLDNAKAWNSSFHYTDFSGASLLGTQFWGTYVKDGSCCYGVYGAEMTYADFTNSHLGYTWFSYADLTGADFRNSFTAGWVIFENADLSEANFGDTHFSEINIRGSDLYFTDFEDAYLRLVVADEDTNWQLTTWTNGYTYNAEPSSPNIVNE
ncbi:MAG: pentapeptide repeat-containing protein, partial [Candidatus Thermoplasmatota archaeon]|nr:pentapeptide repeat-containing protein [Candidatus Thermoplasmatota archaeon]